jgi:protein-histidine pros-kinase
VARRENGRAHEVEFVVADTGMGISPEDQARLFGPFAQIGQQSRRRVEGTGLGLHLSQKLAALLGGRITVESIFGKGSAFTLVLTTGDAVPAT